MKKIIEIVKSFFANEEHYWIMFMTGFMTITLMIITQIFIVTPMVLPIVAFFASLGAMIMVELKDKAWGGKFDFANLTAGLLPSLFFIIVFIIISLCA